MLVLSASASGQVLFSDSFESPIARVDAGGQWTEIYDLAAPRSQTAADSHRGAAGFSVVRQSAVPPLDGRDTQLEWVSTRSREGNVWLRWWMRVGAVMPNAQALVGFGNQLTVTYSPNGLFVGGQDGQGTPFAQQAAPRPDAGWHLYELFAEGVGSADGGVIFVVDGQTEWSGRLRFDFPDAGVHQLNLGLLFAGGAIAFVGRASFDDVRVSIGRPVGRARVTPVSGPWYAGECLRLYVDFVATNPITPLSGVLPDSNRLTLASTPPLPFFLDDQCTIPFASGWVVDAGTTSVSLWTFAPAANTVQNYALTVATDDLLPGQSVLGVQPTRDGGATADAGADAGLDDAGSLDAGADDAGAVVDGGVLLPDGGVASTDGGAGSTDGGGLGPDGGPARERELGVGCACESPGVDLVLAVLVATWARRRRDARSARVSR